MAVPNMLGGEISLFWRTELLSIEARECIVVARPTVNKKETKVHV